MTNEFKNYNEDGSPINPINPDKFLDIRYATAQEVAEFALDHLIEQGCRSVNSEGSCKYKGENGAMCAAAPFIPNYIEEMDKAYGQFEYDTSWYGICNVTGIDSEHEDLIKQLQRFHDKTLFSNSSIDKVARGLEDLEIINDLDLSKYTPEMFDSYFGD